MILHAGDKIQDGDYCHHSSFSRVVNFYRPQVKEHPLLSFGMPGTSPAPHHLIVNECIFAQLKNSKTITIKENEVIFGEKKLTLAKERFASDLSLKNTHSKNSLDQIIERLEKEAQAHIHPDSLMPILWDEPESPRAFTRALHHHFKEKVEHWNSPEEVLNDIPKIQGAGVGLTPSGDDFIAGMIAGLHFLQQVLEVELEKAILSIYQLAKNANPYSMTFLDQAVRGSFSDHLLSFMTALAEKVDFNSELQHLLAYGETSGADWLTGFILTLKRRKIWLPKE